MTKSASQLDAEIAEALGNPRARRGAEATIVYRVEDAQGIGPYQAEVLPQLWRPTKNRPLPEQDFDRATLALLKQGYLFGFREPRGAVRWFGKRTLNTLSEFGLVIRQVPAIDVHVSNSGTQLIFRPAPSYVPGAGREISP
jgi:hypothetical protein